MGYVFEAEHLRLGRPFALKILQLGQWNDELVRRFEREAQALARVRSPRVAQVTDFGVDDVVGPYYVMELVEGETLHDRLDRQRVIPAHEALPIASELCEAVADVHEVGIVHRDLKPGNIGLPIAGPVGVKLLDFGLAASIDDAFLTRITQSHQVLGSLPYIAPEQLSGARPQAEQDLWALGIVLYEMVEGRLPFDQASPAALMHAILTSPLPAFDLAPPALQHVVRQLLEKDPLQRMRSARDAAQLLAQMEGKRLPVTVPGHGGPQRTIPSSDVSGDAAGIVLPTSGVIPSQPPPRSSAIPPTSHSSPAVMIPRTSESPSQPHIPPTSHSFPAVANPSNDFAEYSSVRPPPPRRTPWLVWLVVGLILGALTAVGIVWVLESQDQQSQDQSQDHDQAQSQDQSQDQDQVQAQNQNQVQVQTQDPTPTPTPDPVPDPDPASQSASASPSASGSAPTPPRMTTAQPETTEPANMDPARWTGGIIGDHR